MEPSLSREEIKAKFAALSSRHDVAALLGVSDQALRYNLYVGGVKESKYIRFNVRKKSGGVRPIIAPDGFIKIIQTRLHTVLQCVYEPKDVVQGFKTRKNREVPMNTEVREILSRLCRFKRSSDYVFISAKTGTRLTDIKHSFQRACLLAGIEGLVWYDLRATFGTRLGEAGFDAFTIASLMGHTNVKTTQRYVSATEINKRAAVQAALLGHNLATREQKAATIVAVSA